MCFEIMFRCVKIKCSNIFFLFFKQYFLNFKSHFWQNLSYETFLCKYFGTTFIHCNQHIQLGQKLRYIIFPHFFLAKQTKIHVGNTCNEALSHHKRISGFHFGWYFWCIVTLKNYFMYCIEIETNYCWEGFSFTLKFLKKKKSKSCIGSTFDDCQFKKVNALDHKHIQKLS